MPLYNQLVESGLCVGYSDLAEAVNDARLIPAADETEAAGRIGKRWTGTAWEAVAQAPNPVITKLAFRERFTQDEKVALYTAAKSEVRIQIWLDDLDAAQDLRLDDPRIIAGVQMLESQGMIGAGRAGEILAF